MEKKEHRHSKLKKIPENPFRKDMNQWFPNAKKLYNIADSWEKTVGKYIADHTLLLGVYNDGVLYLVCSDSVLGNEVRLLEKDIIERINSQFGPDYIQKFRFNNSKYSKKQQPVSPEEKEPEKKELTEKQKEEIEKKLASFTDEKLKESIRAMYTNFYMYKDK